jgi:hypothetical protein
MFFGETSTDSKMIFSIKQKGITLTAAEKKKCLGGSYQRNLTLILLTWRIWRAPNNARKWQMRFNLAFKGLIYVPLPVDTCSPYYL